MNITFAVPTYNRLNYLKKMLASLEQSVDVSRLNIRIYDDQSTEYTIDDLRKMLPPHAQITVRPEKLFADGNMFQMYLDFLDTEDDILINADSDLIFRPNWLDITLEILPQTDGVLSIYNCCCHEFGDEPSASPHFAYKKHLGAAGTVFSREIVQKIMDEFSSKSTESFDWRWSAFLREYHIKLACLHESYVQHIGFYGQNNHGLFSDYSLGYNFKPETDVNMQAIDDLLWEIRKASHPDAMLPLLSVEKILAHVNIEKIIQYYGSASIQKILWQHILNKWLNSIRKRFIKFK